MTSIEMLSNADWDRLETDVVTRIRVLKAAAQGLERNPLSDRIAQDLFLPCLRMLAGFCESVDIKGDGG
jgi:hypothetical protein